MYVSGTALSLEHRIHSFATNTGDLFTGYLLEGKFFTGLFLPPANGTMTLINNSGDGSYISNNSTWVYTIYAYKNINNNVFGLSKSPNLVINNHDNNAGQPISLNMTWAPVTGADGYILSGTLPALIINNIHSTIYTTFIDSGSSIPNLKNVDLILWTGLDFFQSKKLNKEFLNRYSIITTTGQTGSYLGPYIPPSSLYF